MLFTVLKVQNTELGFTEIRTENLTEKHRNLLYKTDK